MRNTSMKDALIGAGVEEPKASVESRKRRGRSKSASKRKMDESKARQEAYAGCQPMGKNDKADLSVSRSKSKARRRKKKAKKPRHIESSTYTATNGSVKTIVVGGRSLHSGKPVDKTPKQNVSKPAITTNLMINANTQLNHETLLDDAEHGYWPGILKPSPEQFPSEEQGEIELVIGLDFGTSYCKAVIQEPDSGRSWAVPFTSSRDNPYILLTRVVLGKGKYRLSGDGEVRRNLKVPILEGKMPARHADHVVAFLALVIRHIKQWAIENIWDELAGLVPFWSINMGLAARNAEDTRMKSIFTKLLHAAVLLANLPGDSLAKADAGRGLSLAQKANTEGTDSLTDAHYGEVYLDQCNIFPEIAAQISGYVESEQWDRDKRLFMMVDVGGGTVDGAIFRVDHKNGELAINFLKTRVEQLGVFVLHMKRLKWHRDQLKKIDGGAHLLEQFSAVAEEKVMPGEIPGAVEDYLSNARYPEETVDTLFKRSFATLLVDGIINPVKNRIDPNAREFGNLPYLLCGGGRSIGLYNQFYENMNRPGGSSSVRLDMIKMRKPDKLQGAGIGGEVYHRLSVAYGLSFREPGNVRSSRNLPSPPKRRRESDVSRRYIGAELI